MELQTFVNQNTDYVNKFKEHDLYIRKYSLLNLILVKAKRNVEYDYENNEWMRYCRGVIINSETNRVVCIPPVKSFRKEEIDIGDYDNTYYEFSEYEENRNDSNYLSENEDIKDDESEHSDSDFNDEVTLSKKYYYNSN